MKRLDQMAQDLVVYIAELERELERSRAALDALRPEAAQLRIAEAVAAQAVRPAGRGNLNLGAGLTQSSPSALARDVVLRSSVGYQWRAATLADAMLERGWTTESSDRPNVARNYLMALADEGLVTRVSHGVYERQQTAAPTNAEDPAAQAGSSVVPNPSNEEGGGSIETTTQTSSADQAGVLVQPDRGAPFSGVM